MKPNLTLTTHFETYRNGKFKQYPKVVTSRLRVQIGVGRHQRPSPRWAGVGAEMPRGAGAALVGARAGAAPQAAAAVAGIQYPFYTLPRGDCTRNRRRK